MAAFSKSVEFSILRKIANNERLPAEIIDLIAGYKMLEFDLQELLEWLKCFSYDDLRNFRFQWTKALAGKLVDENIIEYWRELRPLINIAPELCERVKTFNVYIMRNQDPLDPRFEIASIFKPTDLRIGSSSLEMIWNKGCTDLFSNLERLILSVEFSTQKTFHTLKEICARHEKLQLQVRAPVWQNVSYAPEFDPVFQRMESLGCDLWNQRSFEVLKDLCERYPHLRLNLTCRSLSPGEPRIDLLDLLLKNQYAPILGALDQLLVGRIGFLHRLIADENHIPKPLSSLETILGKNPRVQLKLNMTDGHAYLNQSPSILARSEHIQMRANLGSKEDIVSFKLLLENFPKLEYDLDTNVDLLELLLDNLSSGMVVFFNTDSEFVTCKGPGPDVQLITKASSHPDAKTLQLGIGGCALGLHPETVDQIQTAPHAETLCVKWLGPLEPTTGFAASLAKKVSKNLKHLEKVILQNFSGDLDMVQQAFGKKGVNVPVTHA